VNSKTIETIAVSTLKENIVTCDHLEPYINENDKEPSWDGMIYVYNNSTKKKDNIIGTVKVQVKGKESKDISMDTIKYSISVVDMKNYLCDGGAIYFVVYIANGGIAKQIYYVALAPVKIKNILESAKTQKTVSVELKQFPKNVSERERIIFDSLRDFKKQHSFANSKLLTLDELEKQGVLEGVSFEVSTIGGIRPQTALFTSDVYVYANIKGSAVPQPVELLPKDVVITEECNVNISVGERVFYNKVSIIENSSKRQTTIGESFIITYNKENGSLNYKYKNSNKLRVLSRDLDFMLSVISEKAFSYDGSICAFNASQEEIDKFDIQTQMQNLDLAKKFVQLLDKLNCNDEIRINELKAEDWDIIDYLITAFIEEKPVIGLRNDILPIFCVDIANLKFALCIEKVDGCQGVYNLYDLFERENKVIYTGGNGKKYAISQYALFSCDDLIKISNIKFDKLLPSFKAIEPHEELMIRSNLFLLELIKA